MHIDEVNNSRFYQFPQWLLEEPYVKLNYRAKLIYMLLFDRRSLSVKNNWFDENRNVFVYFTNQQLMELLCCSEKSIISAKKKLSEFGLLKEVQQGVNKPNKLFIIGTEKNTVRNCKNYRSGTEKNTGQELNNLQSIKTNNINTNISRPIYQDNNNNTNNIYSVFEQAFGRLLSPFEIEDIPKSVREFGEELVTYALKEAVMNNKVNMKYINGIFNNWRKEGIKTLEQVEENKRNRKRSRKTERDYEYDPQYDLDLIARGEV